MKHSALLIIDVQRDFTVNRAASIMPGTIQTVPYIKNLVKEYRKLAYPIIHVVRLYNTDGSNVDLCRRQAIENGKQIVISGSDGAELIDELKPFTTVRMNSNLLLSGKLQKIGSMEWIMYKPRWGAFYNTPLEKHLDSLDINTVIVCGCNFPNCPRTTIYEASERDFRIVLITDATSVIYNIGLRELKNIGVSLMKSKDCISLLVDMQKDMYT
jgi:nicotinamidase-related amidase